MERAWTVKKLSQLTDCESQVRASALNEVDKQPDSSTVALTALLEVVEFFRSCWEDMCLRCHWSGDWIAVSHAILG